MDELAAHEEAVVRAFVVSARRGRWLEALTDPARRSRFLDRLNHCPDLDPRFVTTVPSGAEVVGLLRSRGAPATCHVLSAADELDGRELPLEQAVAEAEKAGWGTIVSCLPGRLAYYYDECGERKLVLERTP
ncbi:MAG TPA: hypothetical protein VD866_01235 [Urbifossiella sp.]|nr:hypothetical protein [Urbifossiella sp.]